LGSDSKYSLDCGMACEDRVAESRSLFFSKGEYPPNFSIDWRIRALEIEIKASLPKVAIHKVKIKQAEYLIPRESTYTRLPLALRQNNKKEKEVHNSKAKPLRRNRRMCVYDDEFNYRSTSTFSSLKPSFEPTPSIRA
jgi:hypothetical protein